MCLKKPWNSRFLSNHIHGVYKLWFSYVRLKLITNCHITNWTVLSFEPKSTQSLLWVISKRVVDKILIQKTNRGPNVILMRYNANILFENHIYLVCCKSVMPVRKLHIEAYSRYSISMREFWVFKSSWRDQLNCNT